jgi:hypothetical protein
VKSCALQVACGIDGSCLSCRRALLDCLQVAIPGESLGPELVVDGQFQTAEPWSVGPGWAIAAGPVPSGAAIHSEGPSGRLSQILEVPEGVTYRVVYTVTESSGVSPVHLAQIRGGATVSGPANSGDGTFTVDLTTASAPATINIFGGGGWGGKVKSVSVREVL